jgi:hypothetical protein
LSTEANAASSAGHPLITLPADACKALRFARNGLKDQLKALKKKEKTEKRREVALNRKASKLSLQELAQIAVIKAHQSESRRSAALTATSSGSSTDQSREKRPRTFAEAADLLSLAQSELRVNCQ